MTEVGIVRGVDKKEIFSKEFNIYLGISIGNKWFTKNNIRKHLKWALKHTKNKVGILVADTLHAINYEVKEKMKPKNAREKAIRKGEECMQMLHELIGEQPEKDKKKIVILKWEDLRNQKDYDKAVKILYKEYQENKTFRYEVLDILTSYLKNSWIRTDEEKIKQLGLYIIEELPEFLMGFSYKGAYFNCFVYPVDNKLPILVEEIQYKRKFTHLHKLINIKKTAFVELIT